MKDRIEYIVVLISVGEMHKLGGIWRLRKI